MRISFAILLPVLLASFSCTGSDAEEIASQSELTPLSVIADAFTNQQSNIQVMQEGTIDRILSDDLDGDRHQRIIVRLGNDQTLLIAHNIELAPRVPNPQVGKMLRFYGEYEWNDQGGVIHWTHKDPDGVHIDGWLEYEGKRYGGSDTPTLVNSAHMTTNRFSAGRFSKVENNTGGSGEALFDIKGRLLGRALFRRATGIYPMKCGNDRRGFYTFFNDP